MKIRTKVFLALGIWIVLGIVMGAIFGNAGRNDAFKPQNEFKLDPWIQIKLGGLDLSINKAVLYLFIACALTTWAMVFIARRMQQRPNNVQTAVEALYDSPYNTITRGTLAAELAAKRFPFFGRRS